MRDIACKSVAGFQSESYRTKRDAPVRFRPTPPAFALSKNTSAGNKEHCEKEIILIPFQFQFKHTNYLITRDGTQKFEDQHQKCYI